MWDFTRENGLNAIEDDGDGEEGRELGHGVGDGGPTREDVADDVAQRHHYDRQEDCDEERAGRHHYHRECCCSRVSGSQLVAHSHTAYTTKHSPISRPEQTKNTCPNSQEYV